MDPDRKTPPVKKEWYKFISLPGEPDVPNKQTKAASIWDGFKERTTAHGVPHIDKARGWFKLTFWSLVTVACLSMLLWQIEFISAYFWDWKVDVVVKLAHRRELTFPAITFCNTNPLKLSAVTNNSELAAILLTGTSRRKRAIHDDNVINGESTYLGEDSIVRCHHRREHCYSHSRNKRTVSSSDSSFDIEDRTMEILATLSEVEKTSLGYNSSEIFLDCRYAGSNCEITKFTQFFDQLQGNCFMFNSGWDSAATIKTSKRAGRRHGLQLVMNIHQEEFIEHLAQGAGVRIVIHPQDRMPFPTDEGVLATPGQLTSIGVRQVYISRLGNRYGNCADNTGYNATRNVYEQYYAVKYSAIACYKTCYQRYVITNCGCADPQYPTQGEAFGNQIPDICQTANVTQSTCKSEVSIMYQNNELPCDCPVTCEETAYNFEVSNVEWPSDVNQDSVLTEFSSQIPAILALNDTGKALRKNLLKIEVYFQEFNYETMEERPSYMPANYASDIGGILGLWIGCSVLSIFEFFELFIDLVVFLCYRCLGKCSSRLKLKRERSDTSDLVNEQPLNSSAVHLTAIGSGSVTESSPTKASNKHINKKGQKTIVVEGRRIKEWFPNTPPPPYTSSDIQNTTQFHGHSGKHHTLKYV